MTPQALATQLADFANATTTATLPDVVRDAARDRVTDSMGVALAAVDLDTSQAAVRWVRAHGGVERATLFGTPGRVPAVSAGFVNGVLAHSLDYDDTHLPSILHPSSSVVPAALAVGEEFGADGAGLLLAIAVGLEVCVRVGMAGYDPKTNANVYFDRGQHATSICGTVGAAAAAAKLRGLDAVGLRDAMAISASMASGIIEANRGGGNVKRLHCGWAARSGISAAELAEAGFTGPSTVLEGRFGLLQAFLGDAAHPEAVTDGLGERWTVPDIQIKPYPANHFTHTVLDAAAQLRAEGVQPTDLVTVTVGVPTAIVRTIGEPIEAKRTPETAYQAQFSGPYAVALGLLGGSGLGATFADYTDALAQDRERRAIMAKVRVEPDPVCDEIYPYEFPSIITAELADGSTRRVEVLTNRGGAKRPLRAEEAAAKFRGNCARVLTDAAVDGLLDRLARLDELGDVAELLSLTHDRRS